MVRLSSGAMCEPRRRGANLVRPVSLGTCARILEAHPRSRRGGLGTPKSVRIDARAGRLARHRAPVLSQTRNILQTDRLTASTLSRSVVSGRASTELPQSPNCLETFATITNGAPGAPLAGVSRSQELGAKAASPPTISGTGPAGGARSALRPMLPVTPFEASGPTDAPSLAPEEAGTADCDRRIRSGPRRGMFRMPCSGGLQASLSIGGLSCPLVLRGTLVPARRGCS